MSNEVLVVDDEPDIREVIGAALSDVGLNAVEAANGAEALAWLREHSPRFLVLDLAMPVLDGTAVIRELEKQPRHEHIPVVVTAGRSEAEAHLPPTRVVAYLQKPLDYDELVGVLQMVSEVTREDALPVRAEQPSELD